jgi:membrane protein required for colicin V production
MSLAPFDWILLAILLLSMLLGAWRGLVSEVLSVLGWIAAFVVAQIYASAVGQMLPMDGASEPMRYAAGFVAAFVGTAFAAGLLTWLAKKLIEQVGLRPVDRTLGAAFGVLRGAVILLALATVILMTPLKNGQWWQQSAGAGMLGSVLKSLKPVLPAKLGQYINAGVASPQRGINTAAMAQQ